VSKYILISIFLHLIPFISFKAELNKTADNSQIEDVEVISKSKPEGKTESNKCPKNYGGIGVTIINNMVTEVYTGYPAHKNGILVNDYIITPDVLRGEVGTQITLQIVRNDDILTLTMKREKICYK
jgi:C-terminal processing protease CtpA/Prc